MKAVLYSLPFLLAGAVLCLTAGISPATAIGAAAALLAGALVYVRKPFWILLAIIGLVPMDSIGKLGGMLSLTKLLFPPLFALLIWRKVTDRESLWIPQPQRTAFLGFVFALLLSFLFAQDGGYVMVSLKKYVSLLLLYWAALLVISDVREVSRLLYVLVITCAVSSGVGLLGAVAGIDTGFSGVWEGVARTGGMSSEDPNTFAMNVLVAFFAAGSLMISFKSLAVRLLLMSCMFIFSLNLIFSFSRSSLVALFIGAVFFFWSRRREFQWKWVVVFFLVLGISVAPFIPQKYYDRVATLTEIGSSQDVSLRRRMAYHVIGLDLISKSPMWGVGPGNFSRNFTNQDYRYIADTFGHARRLHNMFLSVGSELGLFGLACLLGIVATSFRMANRIIRKAREAGMHEHWRNAQALKYSLFTFLAGCVFLPAEYSKYLWIIFACLSRLQEIFDRDAAAAREAVAAQPQKAVAARPQDALTAV